MCGCDWRLGRAGQAGGRGFRLGPVWVGLARQAWTTEKFGGLGGRRRCAPATTHRALAASLQLAARAPGRAAGDGRWPERPIPCDFSVQTGAQHRQGRHRQGRRTPLWAGAYGQLASKFMPKHCPLLSAQRSSVQAILSLHTSCDGNWQAPALQVAAAVQALE